MGGDATDGIAAADVAEPREPSAVALPSVSVVVATNRVSPFLEEALESVRRQTYGRVEVVIVDDGSPEPDASVAAAAAYPGARVIRQEPSGVAIARNVGVAATTGELIAFLDDDDRWHPERLERQVRSLSTSPGAVAGYCGMQSIDEDGRVIVQADQVAVTSPVEIARRRTGIMLPNLMVRRDALESAGGFHPAIRLAEDLDLVLKLSQRGDFVFTDGALVDYRTHGANTTRRHRELCRSIDRVVRLHMWSARERGDDDLVAAHRESLRANARYAWWGALRAARSNLRSGRWRSAADDLLWAQRFAPGGVQDAVGRRLRGVR